MTKKFSIILILLLTFLLSIALSVQAIPISTPMEGVWGYRSSSLGNGVTANDGWDNGNFEILWEITYNGENPYPWTYEYTINAEADGKKQALNHIILEVSEDTDRSDFTNFSGNFKGSEVGTFKQSNNERYLPVAELYGMRFQGNGKEEITFKFDSTRAPMWGSFFAIGGNNPDSFDPIKKVIAYNVGLKNPSDMEIDYIAVPDTVTDTGTACPIPEPGTILLLGSLLIGLGLIGLKKKLD